jgi:signal transduction histidine kinase
MGMRVRVRLLRAPSWLAARKRFSVATEGCLPTREKLDSLALLSGVRRVFAESQDYESTLSAIAHLVLPYLGSWCAVDVCEPDGSVRRVAVIHSDPTKQTLARALEKGWPPERDDPLGAPAVMRTRRTVSIPNVSKKLLRAVARTPENLQALLALGIGSVITVPLLARDEILGAITFVSDASGHQYNSSDEALAEDLAGIAALALDNAQLYRATIARAKEDSASQAKAEFFSTMSHEIRTPLNAILGYAELLVLGLAGPLTAKQREYLDRLRLSGDHLVELVNDVLDLAKADAGKLTLEGERASTGAAIATAIAATEPSAVAANIRIAYPAARRATDVDGISYVGDERRVRQILINVLANAVKFTPQGGTVTLTCGTSEENPPGTHLVGSGPWAYVRVADTGPGVPSDQRAAVFDPFVQADGGLTRRKGGTGLGLTISRRLARLMGGDLTLDSNAPSESGGATFTLWLPKTNDAGKSASHGAAELPGPRMARALGNAGEFRVYGLAEIGRHVRGHSEEVLQRVATRLRSDSHFPFLERLSVSEVEDHQLSFLVDVVHALIVIDETGGVDSELYRHGGEIQRTVSALHGVMRHHQGWTLEQLERESVIVHEELQALIHRHVPDGMGDVTAALAVIGHLVEQSRDASAQAYRRAALGNPSATAIGKHGPPAHV